MVTWIDHCGKPSAAQLNNRKPPRFTSNLECKSCFYVLRHCLEAARQREEIKECLITVKQVFFSLSLEGSLVDIWAYQAYTLGDPQSQDW